MTTEFPQRVLVAGGTGGTGRLAVGRLGLLGIPTRILTRDRRRAAGLGTVEVVQGDALAEADCRRAVDGCDGVICAVGVHKTRWKRACVDGDGIINLARAAEHAGVRRFVLMSGLGVGDSMAWMPLPVKGLFRLIGAGPLLREKTRSEEYVRSSGLAWTILRPGGLHRVRMRSEPALTTGKLPGLCGLQAVADVAVRCLGSANAAGRVLTVADGWLRCCLYGEPFPLDVPWAPWWPDGDRGLDPAGRRPGLMTVAR
jgi:uncharacterized protein YbjT (DUF2867 family)